MIRKPLLVLPAGALAVVAVALVATSLSGSSRLPAQARSLTDPPRPAVGPVVTVSNEWKETLVLSSPVRR